MAEPKLIWPIGKLHEWEKNPRSITARDFERLKKQISVLGQYKPLIITADGTVLGGNMRLKAYRELGLENIWVSIVEAPDEAKKLEYSLSDNDRAGFYDGDLFSGLVDQYPNFNWGDFSIDLNVPLNISDLLAKFNFDPNAEWNGMPEFDQKVKGYRQILVNFETDGDVQRFAELIGQSLTSKTRYVWFPKKEKKILTGLAYKHEP